MNSTERASSDLLSYYILVDLELGSTIILAVAVLCMGVRCFFDRTK